LKPCLAAGPPLLDGLVIRTMTSLYREEICRNGHPFGQSKCQLQSLLITQRITNGNWPTISNID
jgi:hypothetical protein